MGRQDVQAAVDGVVAGGRAAKAASDVAFASMAAALATIGTGMSGVSENTISAAAVTAINDALVAAELAKTAVGAADAQWWQVILDYNAGLRSDG